MKRFGKLIIKYFMYSAFLFCLFQAGGFGRTALAAHAAAANFAIDAEVRPGDKEIYEVTLTVQNYGENWEGTARLTLGEKYTSNCAYDTALSLPRGSAKQFQVKIPKDSVSGNRTAAHVFLLDRAGRQVEEKDFARLLQDEASFLRMGILSDDFPALTYLDMGGEEIYFYNNGYPVKLEEVKRDTLSEQLSSLTMLVIDQYNTSVLTEEEIEAVGDWVYAGGILVVGTGAYAEDTLSGFEDSFLKAECYEIYPAGEKKPNHSAFNMAHITDNTKIALAELSGAGYTQMYYGNGFVESDGDGAVAVLPFGLAELGQLKATDFAYGDRTEFVHDMLEEVCSNARARYRGNYDNYYVAYTMQRLFSILGNSGTRLKFGLLRAIVISYVIFVGPVLYLLLKLIKKRELYWAAVPLAALLGIGLVYLAGMGFEVREPRVYSVTVQELGARSLQNTYMQCYDAGHREWKLKLSDKYGYAGPMSADAYSHGDSYYYHMQRDGEGLFFGIKPAASFENGYFRAGSENARQVQGNVELFNIRTGYRALDGRVTNGTDRDFLYFAIITDNTVYLYDGLAAGESLELSDRNTLYECEPIYENSYGTHLRQIRNAAEQGETEEAGAQAALAIGMCAVAGQASTADALFIGVTADYEKAVDDVCREASYGCFYAVK